MCYTRCVGTHKKPLLKNRGFSLEHISKRKNVEVYPYIITLQNGTKFEINDDDYVDLVESMAENNIFWRRSTTIIRCESIDSVRSKNNKRWKVVGDV